MKIFGIGLPRSGTSSFHSAMKILGYKSIHFASDAQTFKEVRAGKYDLTVAKENDTLCDIPIPAIFPQLDEAFPGSKFIYTYREVNGWISSHARVPFNRNIPARGSMRDYYRSILYGVTQFNESRFRFVHGDHHRRVMEYFSGPRAADLLVLKITEGEGWEKLCPFLGRDVPDRPFPQRNVQATAPA